MAKPIEQELLTALDPETVRAATAIEEAAIHGHFLRLSSDLAYFNGIYSDVLGLLRVAERRLEFGEADIRLEYRQSTQPSGKAATEGYIDECVKADHRYRKLREEVDNAEVLKSRVSGVVDAIRSKKEMLITVGANMRAELEGDPMIREGGPKGARKSIEQLEREAGYR